MSKVLFVLMPMFKDEEFVEPYEIIKNAGHSADVAGLAEGTIKGSNGHEHNPNLIFEQLTDQDLEKYDALVIPGGPGSIKYLWENKELQNVISYFHENKKVVAAICYAVIAIVKTGLLLHKHATVYPTDEAKAILEEYGVKFSKNGCVSLFDEKIITAQGPKFAKEFGNEIVKLLK